jgi:hypothetical protein
MTKIEFGIGTVVAIVGVMVFSTIIGEYNKSTSPSAVANQTQAVVDDTFAMISAQDAQGVTEKDFTPEALVAFQDWTVERVKVNAIEYLKSKRLPIPDPYVLRGESVYIDVDGKRLMLIRIFTEDINNTAVVIGVNGKEITRVLCTRTNGRIAVSYGVCAAKIKEAFNISMP